MCPYILFVESPFPSLSWLLNSLVVGVGSDLCPLIGVSPPTSSAGSDALVMSRDQHHVENLYTYSDTEGNNIVSSTID